MYRYGFVATSVAAAPSFAIIFPLAFTIPLFCANATIELYPNAVTFFSAFTIPLLSPIRATDLFNLLEESNLALPVITTGLYRLISLPFPAKPAAVPPGMSVLFHTPVE